MKKITLNESQMHMLLNGLAEIVCEDGKFDINIVIDEELNINAIVTIETDGYVEDDYHCGYENGTGAWVETYRNASVELIGWAYDDIREEDVEVEIDSTNVKEVERYLNAAA